MFAVSSCLERLEIMWLQVKNPAQCLHGTRTVSDRCSRPQDPDLFQTSCCSDFRYTNFCVPRRYSIYIYIALNFVHPDNKVAENTESRVAQKRVAESRVAENRAAESKSS